MPSPLLYGLPFLRMVKEGDGNQPHKRTSVRSLLIDRIGLYPICDYKVTVVFIPSVMSLSILSVLVRRRCVNVLSTANRCLSFIRETQTAAGNTLALQVDSEGNVRYDAIAQQGQRAGKIVQSQFKDLVPLAHRKDLDDNDRLMERPSEDEVQSTTDKTRAALEKLINGKIKAAQPKNIPDAHGGHHLSVTRLANRVVQMG